MCVGSKKSRTRVSKGKGVRKKDERVKQGKVERGAEVMGRGEEGERREEEGRGGDRLARVNERTRRACGRGIRVRL